MLSLTQSVFDLLDARAAASGNRPFFVSDAESEFKCV